jgi:dsRNA-specific ribonuclease
MSQQLDELEQRIGYHFHDRDYLRRALTCQSAINERHPDATNQNFQVLEFLGDAALKYAVATLLYMNQNDLSAAGEFDGNVRPLISNSMLSRIGHKLSLSQYIVKGNGIFDPTDKMLADTVEAILGAIVIDQQQQGNDSENILFDVVARLWSITRKDKRTATPPFQPYENKKKCCCCCEFCGWKCFGIIFIIFIILSLTIAYFFSVNADL